MSGNLEIIEVTPENVKSETLFCIKNTNDLGFRKKSEWFAKRFAEGLRLKILKSEAVRPIAFIEYLPADKAWRPVDATGYMFIHCMFVYSNKDKHRGIGSMLLDECKKDALKSGMDGVCVMTSDGSWITNKSLFLKNNFKVTDKRGRFELLSLKLNPDAKDPVLKDWTIHQVEYQGWNLVYSDQCPWNEKSVNALMMVAKEAGITLKLIKLNTPFEAQDAPSGFGVFSLLKDGRLLEDHYLSETRFRNILKQELGK
ncbi:MAG: GNAT family N-acetyltransferase [Bacteroidetes bacterium]|nr:GNAT family N-acetyltransferase [Bacteroidota bacterium]